MPFDFGPRRMILVAVEESELEDARTHAEAVGGERIDPGAEGWLADDLAGAYAVEGGYVLDPMGATVATAEAGRRAGAEFRLGCESKRVIVSRGRVAGLATDGGVIACERIVVATGPRLRFLLRTAGVDLPVAAVRGWLLETGRVDPPPPFAIAQALWPTQEEMGRMAGPPTLAETAAGALEEPGLVSLLLGARPAGHCVIGTSLNRSVREGAEQEETVRRIAARAVRVLPMLADVPVVSVWSGRRALSRDGRPVLGPVPGVDGLEVAGGFGSIGMVTIPALCRRLAAGTADPGFSPARLFV